MEQRDLTFVIPTYRLRDVGETVEQYDQHFWRNPTVVHLDSDKVAWAVTTLVGNALRYMQQGTRRGRRGTINVRTSFDPASAQLIIEVQDDGPGVPTDTVARLFRHDGLNVRGAGLALLLISDICGAHFGAVEVRSSTDASAHGTTVRMTFAAG